MPAAAWFFFKRDTVAAISVEVLIGVTGLSGLTLKLFPRGNDTPANGAGDLMNEQANRKGCYRAVVEEPLEGVHEAYVLDAEGNVLFTGAVELSEEPTIYTVGELGDVAVSTRASATAGASILTALEGLTATMANVAAAIASLPAAVWSYAVRTVTGSTVGASSVEQDENELTLHRGDTLAIGFSELGDIIARQKLWFTLKSKRSDPDASAILLAEETEGILVLAATTPATGETVTITVPNAGAGNVSIIVSAAAAQKLPPTTTGVWDLQIRDGNGSVRTLVHGALKITADITQRIE